MKIAVWRTGHEIADTVADAVNEGIPADKLFLDLDTDELFADEADVHIGYGILRGMDAVFRACQKAGKPFIHIDRGYWKPGHYDGYYRISLNGTQQTLGLDKIEPDYARWDALGIEILPSVERDGEILVCPQTTVVGEFLGQWLVEGKEFGQNPIIRLKGTDRPLQVDLDSCRSVLTFNSSVGWEALRQGIPVVSDPCHSILGAYGKLMDSEWQKDYEQRRRFFAIQAALQLTLEEIKAGKLWPLIQKLLTFS